MQEIGHRGLFEIGSLKSIGSDVPKRFPSLTPIVPEKVPGVYAGFYLGGDSEERMYEMENLNDMREVKGWEQEGKVSRVMFYAGYAKDVVIGSLPRFMEYLGIGKRFSQS